MSALLRAALRSLIAADREALLHSLVAHRDDEAAPAPMRDLWHALAVEVADARDDMHRLEDYTARTLDERFVVPLYVEGPDGILVFGDEDDPRETSEPS